jgi:hypothetical protein
MLKSQAEVSNIKLKFEFETDTSPLRRVLIDKLRT